MLCCSAALLYERINMEMNEIIVLEKMRESSFGLLAACFYLPQKTLLLEENTLRNLSMSLAKICHKAIPFCAEMEKSITNYTEEELQVEYAKLFVGPFELKAPPYGSVYLDGEKRVMGDSTMQVINMYKKEGLSMSADFKELPDHIAVELEFMSYLIYKEIEALEKQDRKAALEFAEKQEIFLNGFLKRWVPAFCEKIKEGTDNKFYNALAGCLSLLVMDSSFPGNMFGATAMKDRA
jgi:TorA maturation chaperone TorD